MADTKVSAMTALTAAAAATGDKLPVIDVSEAAASQNKSMTLDELRTFTGGASVGVGMQVIDCGSRANSVQYNFTSDVTERAVFTATIPQGTVSAGDIVRCEFAVFESATRSTAAFTGRIRVGGVAGTEIYTGGNSNASQEVMHGMADFYIVSTTEFDYWKVSQTFLDNITNTGGAKTADTSLNFGTGDIDIAFTVDGDVTELDATVDLLYATVTLLRKP